MSPKVRLNLAWHGPATGSTLQHSHPLATHLFIGSIILKQKQRQHSFYHAQGGFRLIEITLREPRQLFNNLDPAPFHEKDLETDAEEYIVTAVREIGSAHSIKLVIYLPAVNLNTEDAQRVPEAVHNYFSYREQQTRRELRDLLRRGGISLVIGLVFLFVCLSARGIVESIPTPWPRIFSEGLLIMGWVAMWRPIDVFLYDWWPIRRKQKILQRIITIPVELHQHE